MHTRDETQVCGKRDDDVVGPVRSAHQLDSRGNSRGKFMSFRVVDAISIRTTSEITLSRRARPEYVALHIGELWEKALMLHDISSRLARRIHSRVDCSLLYRKFNQICSHFNEICLLRLSNFSLLSFRKKDLVCKKYENFY